MDFFAGLPSVVLPVIAIAAAVAVVALLRRGGSGALGTSELPPEDGRGRRLDSWSPGGRLGAISYRRGSLTVELYEAGLIVRPLLGRGQWVAREAITSLEYARSGTLTRGSVIRTDRGEAVLWSGEDRHARLLSWWRAATRPLDQGRS